MTARTPASMAARKGRSSHLGQLLPVGRDARHVVVGVDARCRRARGSAWRRRRRRRTAGRGPRRRCAGRPAAGRRRRTRRPMTGLSGLELTSAAGAKLRVTPAAARSAPEVAGDRARSAPGRPPRRGRSCPAGSCPCAASSRVTSPASSSMPIEDLRVLRAQRRGERGDLGRGRRRSGRRAPPGEPVGEPPPHPVGAVVPAKPGNRTVSARRSRSGPRFMLRPQGIAQTCPQSNRKVSYLPGDRPGSSPFPDHTSVRWSRFSFTSKPAIVVNGAPGRSTKATAR